MLFHVSLMRPLLMHCSTTGTMILVNWLSVKRTVTTRMVASRRRHSKWRTPRGRVTVTPCLARLPHCLPDHRTCFSRVPLKPRQQNASVSWQRVLLCLSCQRTQIPVRLRRTRVLCGFGRTSTCRGRTGLSGASILRWTQTTQATPPPEQGNLVQSAPNCGQEEKQDEAVNCLDHQGASYYAGRALEHLHEASEDQRQG